MKNVNREEMVRAAVQGRGGEGGCAGWGGGVQSMQMWGRGPRKHSRQQEQAR